MLPTQPSVIHRIIPKRPSPIQLCANNQIVPLPPILFNRLAHDNLALALGVAFCAVEEVDADVVGGFHNLKRLLVFHVTAVGEPAAERDGGDLEAGAAEEAVWFGSCVIMVFI